MKPIDSDTFFKSGLLQEPNSLTLLGRQQAAARLSISVATLDRLTRSGELPRVKLAGKVLYRPESLDEFARRKEAWAKAVDIRSGPAA